LCPPCEVEEGRKERRKEGEGGGKVSKEGRKEEEK